MADTDKEGGKKTGGYTYGAFAHTVHAQQKYIVFNLDALDYDTDYDTKGAERNLPHMASHELFHVLGLSHPNNPSTSNEDIDTRDWPQIRRDIASGLTTATALGSVDSKTQMRTITYSFAGRPSQVPAGQEAFHARSLYDPSYVRVDSMQNLGDTNNEGRNSYNHRIKDAMHEAFKTHEELFNIRFVETSDPAKANLLVYAGVIPRIEAPTASMSVGLKNAYSHDVTVMSYNSAQANVFAMTGVGDVHAIQSVYGTAPKDPKRHIISTERLTAQSGVLWDHDPLVINLDNSKASGNLIVTLPAHPYTPAITGLLQDEEGKKIIRQHVAQDATIREINATGSDIMLTATGADNSIIKVGNGSYITLNGQNNRITLGPGSDIITVDNGYGHGISQLAPEDEIRAPHATKASVEYWNAASYSDGSLVTLWNDLNQPTGSIFVHDARPEQIIPHLKGLALVEPVPQETKLAFTGVDRNDMLKDAAMAVTFNEPNDVLISARNAAGRGLGNVGQGVVVVSMTRPQYDSKTITWHKNGDYYALQFMDEGKLRTTHLRGDSKLAVTSTDGTIEKLIGLKDAQTETRLAQALRTPLQQDKASDKPGKQDIALDEIISPSLMPHRQQQTSKLVGGQ